MIFYRRCLCQCLNSRSDLMIGFSSVSDICRLQPADYRLQTTDCRRQTTHFVITLQWNEISTDISNCVTLEYSNESMKSRSLHNPGRNAFSTFRRNVRSFCFFNCEIKCFFRLKFSFFKAGLTDLTMKVLTVQRLAWTWVMDSYAILCTVN